MAGGHRVALQRLVGSSRPPGPSPAPETGRADRKGFAWNSWMRLPGVAVCARINSTTGLKKLMDVNVRAQKVMGSRICVLSSTWLPFVIQQSFIQPKVSKSVLNKGIFLLIHLDRNSKS